MTSSTQTRVSQSHPRPGPATQRNDDDRRGEKRKGGIPGHLKEAKEKKSKEITLLQQERTTTTRRRRRSNGQSYICVWPSYWQVLVSYMIWWTSYICILDSIWSQWASELNGGIFKSQDMNGFMEFYKYIWAEWMKSGNYNWFTPLDRNWSSSSLDNISSNRNGRRMVRRSCFSWSCADFSAIRTTVRRPSIRMLHLLLMNKIIINFHFVSKSCYGNADEKSVTDSESRREDFVFCQIEVVFLFI